MKKKKGRKEKKKEEATIFEKQKMYTKRTLAVLLLVALCSVASLINADEEVVENQGPVLIVYKTVLNSEVVLDRPISVNIKIYNVGDEDAYDINLRDNNWIQKNPSISRLYGSPVASWPTLASYVVPLSA
jgi:Translocon-associated protein beta (TRAPB)